MRYAVLFFTSVLVVVVVGACDNRTIPPETFDAVVHGRVSTPQGEQEVNQAYVIARAYTVSCNDTTGAESYREGDFNTRDGQYEVLYQLPVPDTIACVRVRAANAPFNQDPTRLADTTATVDLQANRSEAPLDSTGINVVLREQ